MQLFNKIKNLKSLFSACFSVIDKRDSMWFLSPYGLQPLALFPSHRHPNPMMHLQVLVLVRAFLLLYRSHHAHF
jgi:hypothetical protein